MAKIEVWEEGYATTGEHCETTLAGTFEAQDFEGACQQLLAQRRSNPAGWGLADKMHRIENGIHYWWGCKWAPTAKTANQDFWRRLG